MPEVPEEIRQAFRQAAKPNPGPLSYRWVFNPQTAEVHVEHDEKHNLEVQHHSDLARKVNHHPERVHGYAYRLRNGWRIVDWEDKPVPDPFIVARVRKALGGQTHKPHHERQEIHSSRLHYGRIVLQ